MIVGYYCFPTEYPEPQVVNENEKSVLYVTLNGLSLPDRLLQIEANYSIDPDLPIPEQGWELRAWISEPVEETTASNVSQSNSQDGAQATVTITVTPLFGTPVPKIGEPSVIISGIMIGEPRRFPFDVYSASIGTQNDWTEEIREELPFRFNTENHLKDYELYAIRGDSNIENIRLDRNLTSQIIPFASLFILLIYACWVLDLSFYRKTSNEISLVSNVALLLSILSLRALVVPDGIPFGCTFDFALIVPAAVILSSIFSIIWVQTKKQPR